MKAKLRENRAEAAGSNEVWAMDFVRDQLAAGRKLRVLTIVDTWPRYAPAVDPRFSYRGEDVVRTLEEVCAMTGYPKTIRVDQGTEFVSRNLDLWAYENSVVLDFSRSGKPTDNVRSCPRTDGGLTTSLIGAFNSKFRQGRLNTHWLMTLADAREKMETWRRLYNEDRPHSAIGCKVPITLAKPDGAAGLPS